MKAKRGGPGKVLILFHVSLTSLDITDFCEGQAAAPTVQSLMQKGEGTWGESLHCARTARYL